jgi:spermidine synthase|tara:strand:- start:149 stop:763 length:615 start_codon:yes stop_codon:yes gene_type:complete
MKKLIDILKDKKYQTDKWTDHYYVQDLYEPLFEQFQNKKVNVLEIGVWNGESMKLWHDYFVNAKNIVGIDIFVRSSFKEVSGWLKDYDVKLHKFNSHEDTDKFNKFADTYKEGFDIIIDDGSHWYENQINTYKKFKNLMNPGGVYIIEDISFEREESVYTSYKLTESGMQNVVEAKIQRDIPEMQFYMTGGELFQNQPVGVIYF